ncbi:riboflavin synthase subunit alpha [Colwellia sp. BRX10-3]|uniref:riboflavin synthase subunit alpha n=1 Tax=Colwellia sp. BRX10-3 TaxID=2759844 RepID=UPI0015F3996B|nr:riboflavin synthase subunit alpha [Colwellia sp. BRX10-3]MBA6390570.1 riboflavin synthase subunit alpha [Colwellia sp. BRX10-3]
MFTGIVQSQAEVIAIISKNNAIRLKIAIENTLIDNLEIGASVAINGVCLTVVEFGRLDEVSSFISFDVIDETLRVSNLADIELGTEVNVERSLKIGDEIGGHMLSGHVHTQAILANRIDSQDNCTLSFTIAAEYKKYIFAKGFISINGISLTLGADVGESFSVHLIPETLARTNLQYVLVGDKVNIEIDQQTMTIVETIERMKLSLN